MTKISTKNSSRAGFLDEVRGFAIICMVVYHVLFDLKYLHGVNVPVFFDDWFDTIRDIFAGAFIFISGTVCRYSRSNYKRGVQCFFIGMIITFVTAFVTPQFPVYFGILHLLGISMLIFALTEPILDKLPPFVGVLLFALLFIATYSVTGGYIGIKGVFSLNLPDVIYSAKLLFPLGFPSRGFSSGDYFPLLPWLFLFLSGSFFGVWAVRGQLPRFFYNTHVRFLAYTGRYTLWIYVLHQPLAYIIMMWIFG
ncbi:MAG: DUF1624 domain-containing protein [Oscillospiraceae bacterium]|jgi:uncharacterized membrane protein|nr:DUF1624 domain-containing protein [Oscillospiraceae bacterium]